MSSRFLFKKLHRRLHGSFRDFQDIIENNHNELRYYRSIFLVNILLPWENTGLNYLRHEKVIVRYLRYLPTLYTYVVM